MEGIKKNMNMKTIKNNTEARALHAILEANETFSIEVSGGKKKELSIYPLQLGKLAMISQRLLELDLVLDDECSDAVQKMWHICSKHPRKVAEIIAISTLRTKDDLDAMLKERTEELLWSPTMDTRAYANLLYLIVFQSYYKDFMTAIRSVRTLRVTVSRTEAERIAPTEDAASGER